MIVRTALFLTIVSISTVFAVFKDGNEYVYTYTGEVEIGTTKPAEYYSYSDVIADLHVKPVKGDLQIWIENVRYLTYSGSAKGDVDDATKEVPMPNDSGSLTIPFVYHRYTNKTESGISTSKEDELWSIKMKQAIASLLYVNEEGLNKDKPSVCHMEDFTLCSVKDNGDNLQMLATKSDTLDPEQVKKNWPDGYPTIRRNYDLKKESEGFTLEKVTSLSSHRGYQELEVFYIYVNQTIQLKESSSSDLKEMDTSSLIYHAVEKDSVLHKNKKTSNNLPEEGSNDILELQNHLKNIYNDLKNLQPTTKRSFVQQNELKEMLIELESLNEEQLNNLFSSVSENPYLHDLMLETTLLTNSPKAYCFTTKLIENQKLNVDESMNLLIKMSSNPIPLTECLEKSLLKLAYDEQLSKKKLRHQAIITLASMIRVSPDTDKFDHIVKEFVKNVKDSKHDSERAIYVHALQNADTFESRLELIDIARGSDEVYKNLSGHIRALATNCIKYEYYRDFVFQDLIDNGKQDFEVRATALNVLLDSIDEVQSSKIINNLLLEGDEHELYELLYAKLESISKMTSRNKAKAVKAKKIIHQLTKPMVYKKTATSQVFDYTDEFSGRGLTFEITTYGNMIDYDFITCRLKLTMIDLYLNEYSYEWYVHLTNGKYEISIMDIIASLDKMSVEREVIGKKDGFVVSVGSDDLKQILVDIFQGKLKRNTVSASQLKNIETVIHTDMGTSVIFSDQMICLNKINSEVIIDSNTMESRIAFDSKRRCVNYLHLSAYNPVANVWHGARSVVDSDFILPFDFHLKVDHGKHLEHFQTFTLYKSNNPFGFQATSRSFVYMEGEEDDEACEDSCPKCNSNSIVTKGENHLENKVLSENYIEDVGLGYKLSVFDCEEHLTLASLKSLKYVMPTAMCGIRLVIKNIEENPVTQLELKYHVIYDNSLADDLITISKIYKHFNYSLKNDDKVLKSWDISNECTNYFHNSSDCKIDIVSKKGGVTDHIIYGNNSKIFNPEGVFSTWKIHSSNDVDGKQSDDSTSLSIEHTATNKNTMNSKINLEKLLVECDTDTKKTFEDCMRHISSFRMNTFNISYSNLKPKHLWLWTKVTDLLRLKYADTFKRIDKYNNAENCVEITVTHPFYRDNVDVSVITPHEAYEYDLSLDKILSTFFVTLPHSGLYLDEDFSNAYCEVGSDYLVQYNYGDREELKYEKDWNDLASKCNDETGKCIWRIEAKKMNEDSDDLVLRFKIGKDVIEVAYTDDFEIKLNDKLFKLGPNELTRVSNMLDVMTLSLEGKTKRVIVHAVPKVINIEYTRNRIRISLPYPSQGKCIS